ncbi:N-6 DNA methylase [Longispora sp. NPDC051575]|uniref:N-6 DNA methylase n=1 Tax=Longispora sp. NPDC051575 TaxID=3154943 RepID=UPI003437AE87
MTTKRRRPPIGDPYKRAVVLAEAIAATWGRSASGGSDLEIPVGVVAALALVRPADPNEPDPAEFLLALDADGFAETLRTIWATFAAVRPDLSPNVYPVRNWLWEDRPARILDAARDVGRTAVDHGLLDLVADYRMEIDVFGTLLVELRPKSAISGRGQYYTPHPVAAVMARMLRPKPGERVLEPAVGTGGMLLAAAEALRADGHDPATVKWYANDIDPIAIACLAVNAHLWELGPHVLFAVANALTEPDWIPGALAARDIAISEVRAARMVAAFQSLMGAEGGHELSE